MKTLNRSTEEEVVKFLRRIGLGDKTKEVKENHVNGESLMHMNDDDLQRTLGLDDQQAKKVRESVIFSLVDSMQQQVERRRSTEKLALGQRRLPRSLQRLLF